MPDNLLSENIKSTAQPNLRLVPPGLQQAVRRSAVFSFLIRDCLNLCVGTMRDIESVWGLDGEQIERLGIRSAPSRVTNLIASGAVAERFGDLSDIPGFYRCDDLWWIDVDEKLAGRGIVLPIRDALRPSRIVGLRIFRHVRDQKSFMLRLRAERADAA